MTLEEKYDRTFLYRDRIACWTGGMFRQELKSRSIVRAVLFGKLEGFTIFALILVAVQIYIGVVRWGVPFNYSFFFAWHVPVYVLWIGTIISAICGVRRVRKSIVAYDKIYAEPEDGS